MWSWWFLLASQSLCVTLNDYNVFGNTQPPAYFLNAMKLYHVTEVTRNKKLYLSGSSFLCVHVFLMCVCIKYRWDKNSLCLDDYLGDCSSWTHSRPLKCLLFHFTAVPFMLSSTEFYCPLQLLRSLRSVCFYSSTPHTNISSLSHLCPHLSLLSLSFLSVLHAPWPLSFSVLLHARFTTKW